MQVRCNDQTVVVLPEILFHQTVPMYSDGQKCFSGIFVPDLCVMEFFNCLIFSRRDIYNMLFPKTNATLIFPFFLVPLAF